MSYILDALRKADAQRTRDSARGINAQGARSVGGAPAQSNRRPWYYLGAAVVVVVVGVAGWALFGGRSSVQESASVAKAPRAEREEVVAVAPIINAEPQREPPAGEPIRMPMMAPMARVVGTEVQPAPPTPPSPEQFAQIAAEARNAARQNARKTPLAGDGASLQLQFPPPGQQQPPSMDPPQMPTQPPVASPGPVALPPPVAANAPPPPPVAGLPADAPKLSISGGVYSANRAQRMLIVNGQVFSEGSEISSGVVLDEVRPKIAILRFKGAKYTVSY